MGAGAFEALAPDLFTDDVEEEIVVLYPTDREALYLADDTLWGVLEKLKKDRADTQTALEMAQKRGHRHQTKTHEARLQDLELLIVPLESARAEIEKVFRAT